MDITDRLLNLCKGYPYAKVKWPHRELHEAVQEIIMLREQLKKETERCATLAEALDHSDCGCGSFVAFAIRTSIAQTVPSVSPTPQGSF